jgi:hypothetical protein
MRQSEKDRSESVTILERLKTLVAEIRFGPEAFPDIESVVARSGFPSKRLGSLFCRHYHATVDDVLSRAKLEAAKRLLL